MSSSRPAIRVTNLSKSYQIYSKPQHRFFQSLFRGRKQFYREFWALRDVSFDIGQGETVGVIGRNGSGKSTLLQLVAGTLEPTQGIVKVEGRASAILELGAGFNPEFTGRENVILNTAVLGMSAAETNSRMGDIATFADIGEFIDQPVKTYSSGMYARLAFAVAIHVDPQVLIVDEALAVGDAKFQAQCFRKFEEFKERGITVLFVSHSVEQIVRHCSRAVLLEEGRVLMSGEPKPVVARYLELLFGESRRQRLDPIRLAADTDPRIERLFGTTSSDGGEGFARRLGYNHLEHRWGDNRARIVDYLIVSTEGAEPAVLHTGDSVSLYVRVLFCAEVSRVIFGIAIKTPDGVEIAGSNSRDLGPSSYRDLRPRRTGDEVVVRFDFECAMNSGDYLISVGAAEELINGTVIPMDRRYDSIHVHVVNGRISYGLVDLKWNISDFDATEVQSDAVRSALAAQSTVQADRP